MSLREKLLKYQAKDLIEVAEPHSDYTHEAKTIAIDIIKENNAFNFKKEAQLFWEEKIKKDIKSVPPFIYNSAMFVFGTPNFNNDFSTIGASVYP